MQDYVKCIRCHEEFHVEFYYDPINERIEFHGPGLNELLCADCSDELYQNIHKIGRDI